MQNLLDFQIIFFVVVFKLLYILSVDKMVKINIPGLAGLIVFYFLILFAGLFSKKYVIDACMLLTRVFCFKDNDLICN